MINATKLSKPFPFSEKVLEWFAHSGRHDLPWQQNLNPYRVWVSEIMLQQTQVNTVIPYFLRFTQAFPTLSALAKADLNEVLEHWSGLGYYARARNLHKTAQKIQAEYQGEFPQELEALSTLPGIGRSTAGAILSLALNIPAPILDGNVRRVLSRFQALEGWPGTPKVLEELWRIAELYTPSKKVQAYSQAMMDLGATVCTRTKPKCALCPLAEACQAHQKGKEGTYPYPKARSIRPIKSITWLLLRNAEGALLLEQRGPTGIWGGLWCPPECPTSEDISAWCQQKFACTILHREAWPSFKHVFSHFELKVQPLVLDVEFDQRQLRETHSEIWLKASDKLPGGLAAPVKKLLIQLGYKHATNRILHETAA